MKKLKQEYLIKAGVEKVWAALVDPGVIDDWGGGPAVMNDRVGTEFKLWGGDIWGTNAEVVSPSAGSGQAAKLIQAWYGGRWEKPSRVGFFLEAKGDKTRLTLLQEDIPDEEYEAIKDGWKRYYLGPMKEYLERK